MTEVSSLLASFIQTTAATLFKACFSLLLLRNPGSSFKASQEICTKEAVLLYALFIATRTLLGASLPVHTQIEIPATPSRSRRPQGIAGVRSASAIPIWKSSVARWIFLLLFFECAWV